MVEDREKEKPIRKKVREISADSSEIEAGKREVAEKVIEVSVVPEEEKAESDTPNKEQETKNKPEHTLYINPGAFEVSEDDFEFLSKAINDVSVQGYKSISWFRKFKASLFSGHSVASEKDYKCGTASYSTKTSIIETEGRKYFVVYNYPGSNMHRKSDTGCRSAWGEKALKATEEKWRDVFTSRSLIPVKEGSNDRIVILPFIPNISVIDLLEKYDDDKFKGDYEYGHQFKDIEAKKKLVNEISSALKQLHDSNRTWGEIIPANLGVSKDGKILFFDPETPYVEGTSEIEQKARDLWSLCMSSCGALNRSQHKYENYPELINGILQSYGDEGVVDYMKKNLCEELSWRKIIRHPIAWGQFKSRLTSSGRKQYNAVMQAIIESEINI